MTVSRYVIQTLKMLLFGSFLTFFVLIFTKTDLSDYFSIRTVKVYGIQRVDKDDVQNLLLPLVTRGFFTINVASIRERLLQLPWVADIFVRRSWPDQVDITIVEKNAIARWSDQNLLSDGGEIFSPDLDTYPSHLPIFVGPDGRQVVMLQYFNDMNRLLAPLHAKISYLELTPFLTWKVTLDNGINLQIGDPDGLRRLNQFVKVYPKIIGDRAADVEYVDLRYSNGVAVRWKHR